MQADLAALIGASVSQISRIECDRCLPTTQQLLALCIVYGKDCRELMSGHAGSFTRSIQRDARDRSQHVRRDIAAQRAQQRAHHLAQIGKRLR